MSVVVVNAFEGANVKLDRVLSVDDSVEDQFLSDLRLRAVNPEVEIRTAGDGVEALEILRDEAFEPDLILLDVNMPRMDGMTFLEHYASEFEHGEDRVLVVLSSSGQQRDRERAARFGCVAGYLVKPLTRTWPDDLAAALGEPIDDSQS